jgi:hypothetical protein
MTPDEFYRGLEDLGFTDSGVRSPDAPELRSYDPPERLRSVLSSVNIGRTFLDSGVKYLVTLQASGGFDTCIIEVRNGSSLSSARTSGRSFSRWTLYWKLWRWMPTICRNGLTTIRSFRSEWLKRTGLTNKSSASERGAVWKALKT